MPAPPEARAALGAALARFWTALEGIDDMDDRRVALDCARDALDRGAERLSGAPHDILATTYSVECALSEGATGVVLRARHRDLGQVRAIKTLRATFRRDPLIRRLFLREARHHLQVRDPAVVEAETAIRLDDGSPAVVMALVDGPSLAALRLKRSLTTAEAAILGSRLAKALAAIHGAGLLHLDVSPANVLLPGGEIALAQLCDFGLSLPIGASRAGDEVSFAATPAFAPPEQLDPARRLDERADLFSLGALIRSVMPRTADTACVLAKAVDALAAPSPSDRIASASAAKAAFDFALASLSADPCRLDVSQPEAALQQAPPKAPAPDADVAQTSSSALQNGELSEII